ncbi:MAG: FRG domain-containing protein [Bacteroidales bacterium]|nr:FRG domain-containing protein [Bacteroidales bacterium]
MRKEIVTIEKDLSDWELYDDTPVPIESKHPIPLEIFPSVISSIDDFKELIETISFYRSFRCKHFFFRGHSDKKYSLVSTIGRTNLVKYSSEYEVFKKLKELCEAEGYSRFRMKSFNEELFYYGIGRHLGLTCRLLDWTAGIWQALSFALYENDNCDAALWVMMLPNDYPLEDRSPFSIEDNKIHILKEDYYRPDESTCFPLGIQRRSHQCGVFSVVKDSWISSPLNEIPSESQCDFFCFIIPKEVKNSLRQDKSIINVEEWLYITKETQITDKIVKINHLITNNTDNER